MSNDSSPVTKHILEQMETHKRRHMNIVWTFNMRKLTVLVAKAIEFKEPVLLVGETGGGKTTVCQLLAENNDQSLFTVNCHMHTESSDFIGGLRPVRDHSVSRLLFYTAFLCESSTIFFQDENLNKLFEWVDGPLIMAMTKGGMFLADEISLADDSVLERMNSLLGIMNILLFFRCLLLFYIFRT